jgi:hypothetical protein
MPDSTDYKNTQGGYTSELTLGPSELGATITLEIYNAAVTFVLAQKDPSGVASFQSGNEVSLGPGIATFGNCQGIKVRSNAPGLPAIANATMYYVGEVVPNLTPNPTELSLDPVTGDATVDPMSTTGGGGNVPDGGITGDVLTKLSNTDQDDDWAAPGGGGGGNPVEIQPTIGMVPQDASGDTIYVDNADLIELRAHDFGTNVNSATLRLNKADQASLATMDSHNVFYNIGVSPDVGGSGHGQLFLNGGFQAGRAIVISGQVDPAGLLVTVNNVVKHIPLV